jgi:hypothetical protein
MPPFTLRWTNRSGSTQDWIIQNLDQFTLQPDHVRSVNVNLNNNFTFNIAVDTTNTFAAAALTYTAGTNVWSLNTNTPNEWQLAVGGGLVTLRCMLNAVASVQTGGDIGYAASDPVPDGGA